MEKSSGAYLKIAFDASSLAFPQKTGTGVYSEELIGAFEKTFPEDSIIHAYRLSRRLRGSQYIRALANSKITRTTLVDPITSFKGFGFDIFHGLNTRLPVLRGTKLIASVHDLFSIYGDFSNPEFREDQAKKLKKMIDRSHHIIASCTFTKAQLVEKMGINKDKISVVLLGVKELFLADFDKAKSLDLVRSKFGLKNSYLFFTGALEKRKNIIGLVNGYSKYIQNSKSNIDLVIAGHPGFEFENINETIERSPFREKIKRLGFVSDTDLAHLYRSCEAFVFPSFAEGFGMPVLEAMASGAPVISSNTTSLPEAGGGFAWSVDPNSVDELVFTIEKVLSQTSMIKQQTLAGQSYARKQKWEKVARQTRDVYLHVLSSPQISLSFDN